MNRKILNYFEIAARTALSKRDDRSFLIGSVGIRGDGAMVKALNAPTELPNSKIHSEFRLIKKLDYGAEVYVARVRLDSFMFGMSRPCHSCRKALRSKKVSKVYYTIDDEFYGIWYPDPNIDKVYRFPKDHGMKFD